MRPGLLLAPLVLLALTACGGSSSETPWPVEPDAPPPGPAGEAAPAGAPADVPEAPAEAPADAPEPPAEGEEGAASRPKVPR